METPVAKFLAKLADSHYSLQTHSAYATGLLGHTYFKATGAGLPV